ncbi:MAG: serine/threonine protein phosphatase [Clostridia bacterium]|nr:serine/threonine protein phosphatase [Clostridia bacterium]
MAKLITKFKYLKPSARQSVGGYAKYIATREGVEKVDDTFKTDPPTEKQKKLIERILRDFKDSKDMLEYEDYLKEPTLGNASEFITRALEDNAHEASGVKTYADYIATRPRVERFGSHGLFTDDGVRVKLEDVSKELNKYEGNVWTVIISLRREDAERLGFNSGKRWRDMLRTQTETIAKSFKIPVGDLKWYAAFHNESHHPHVHLMVYSSEQAKPYLTQKGIMNLRSSFAKDIFADDLFSVYEKQTEHRNALRAQSREMIAGIVSRINNGTYDNPVVENKLLELAERLSKTRGKKQYGYLKADVKAIVNGIVSELASDERIAALYDLWYEQREEVIRTYTEELPDRIPLVDNPEFKPIKNAVIREALKILGGSLTDNKQDEQKSYVANNGPELIDRSLQEEHSGRERDVVLSTARLFHYLSKMIQNQIDSGTQGTMKTTDRKLKRRINEKKYAHGLKQG